MKTKQFLLAAAVGLMSASTAFAVQLQGHITTNTTLDNTAIHTIKGFVYVDAGVTLTILPGTILQGVNFQGTDGFNRFGTLIISQGAQIIAQGTNTNPIIFTSTKAPGFRVRGDWGGVVIAGNATTNLPVNSLLEGGIVGGAALSEPKYEVPFGGTNDADNSGVFSFVRIEWAGIPLFLDREINGLTLAGVGSGTTINNIQVSHSNDDSFEWFGGTVNGKNLISWKATDDDFDTDNGYSGQNQFGLAFRSCDVADFVTGGRSNGFESDNDATSSANTPKTSAKFFNFTILGPQNNIANVIAAPYATAAAAYERRNTEQDIYASVLAGFPNGVTIDGATTVANANGTTLTIEKSSFAANDVRDFQVGGTLSPDANTWFSTRNDVVVSPSSTTPLQLKKISKTCAENNNGGTLTNLFSAIPKGTSPLVAVGSGLNAAALVAAGANSFIIATNYTGAFSKVASKNWAAAGGFAEYDPQNFVYTVGGPTMGQFNSGEVASSKLATSIYPNPSRNGEFFVNFDSEVENTNVIINVYDMTSKLVKTITKGSIKGNNTINVEAMDLTNGIYLVTVQSGNDFETIKFTVDK